MKASSRFAVVLLVIALAGGITYSVARVTRSVVAQQLSQRLLADETDPKVVIPQLAKLDTDAIAPLVQAAASPKRGIAMPARRQIDRLLEDWWIETQKTSRFDLRKRLNLLADELLANAEQLSPTGQHWARQTARRVIRLAAEVAPGEWSDLVTQCDRVLAATHRHTKVVDLDAMVVRPRTAPANLSEMSPEPTTEVAIAPPAPTEPQPFLADVANEPTQHEPSEIKITPIPQELPPPPRELSPSLSAIATPNPQQPATQEERWTPEWNRSNVTQDTNDSPLLPTEPPNLAPPVETFANLSDRELLRRYTELMARSPSPFSSDDQTSDAEAKEPTPGDRLRQAVINRGYGRVAARHVHMLLTDDVTMRRKLVAELLSTGHGESTRLLFLLATDPSARVRSDAIAALGASQDPRLIEVAWKLAIKDSDPQVARLAKQLDKRRR